MTNSKIKRFNAVLKLNHGHLGTDKGIGEHRDRVLLAGMQRALNLCSTEASTLRDEYLLMKPGDPHLYPEDLRLVTDAYVQIIQEWQSQVDVFGLLQKFIDDNTSGVYIIVVEPRLDGIDLIEVKVGKTTRPAHRLMLHQSNWLHSELLDYLPLYQCELGTLKAFEDNALVYAGTHMDKIVGQRERFHTASMDTAYAFARRARKHYIKT